MGNRKKLIAAALSVLVFSSMLLPVYAGNVPNAVKPERIAPERIAAEREAAKNSALENAKLQLMKELEAIELEKITQASEKNTADNADVADVEINAANFPDDIFRSYILEQFDKDGNNILSGNEIALVSSIIVSEIPTQQEELTGKGRFYVVWAEQHHRIMWCCSSF